MTNWTGFPIVNEINNMRYEQYAASHDTSNDSSARLGSWIGHKIISAIALPINSLAVAAGTLGMLTTGCTLGALKIALYIGSLGNIESEFPIGFLWCTRKTAVSVKEVSMTVIELIRDCADPIYQTYRGVKWVLTALKLNHLIPHIQHFLKAARERIKKAGDLAVDDEKVFNDVAVPSLFSRLQQVTSLRSAFEVDQTCQKFIEHKLLSVVNLPLQTTAAVISGAVCAIGLVAIGAKIALYALTNFTIPVSTGVFYTGKIFINTASGAATNSAELIADTALLGYRAVDSLGIIKAAVRAKDVLLYIPKAILS